LSLPTCNPTPRHPTYPSSLRLHHLPHTLVHHKRSSRT
jgi:hypothetical protein